MPRLGKRLAYILRYGAIKEGLNVQQGGFVKLDELLTLGLMKWHNKDEVLREVSLSKTAQGIHRFDLKYNGKDCLVRAASGRNFDLPITHENSTVLRLLELCFNYVSRNIKLFDLEDFPDEFLLSRLFLRLKHEKRLSNTTMACIFGNAMEYLNLHGVFVTEGTFKLLTKRCPNLKSLELKSCGYVVTDKIVELICKNFRRLRKLNLCDCGSVTDKSLSFPARYGLKLEWLNINYVPRISFTALKLFIQDNPSISHLHVHNAISPFEVEVLKSYRTNSDTLEIISSSNKSCHRVKSYGRQTTRCAELENEHFSDQTST